MGKETPFYSIPKAMVTEAYATALQMCLIDCAKGLVEIGINPAVQTVTRQIWLRALEVSKLLVPDTFANALKKYREQMLETKWTLDEEQMRLEDSGDGMHGQAAPVWICTLWRILDLRTVVWVCFAACMELREGVTPVDMALWIKEGRIPFMSLELYGKQAMSNASIEYPQLLMRPWGPPRPMSIASGTVQLCLDVGLSPAPLNVPLHLLRIVHSLELPKVVGELAVEVHRIYGRSTKKTSPSNYLVQYIELGAHVLIAMKHYYGLDGVERSSYSGESSPPTSWVKWAADAWTCSLSLHFLFDVSMLELDRLKRCDIQKLSMSCQSGTNAHCAPISNLCNVLSRLERLCIRKEIPGDEQPNLQGFVRSKGWKYSLSDIKLPSRLADCFENEDIKKDISRLRLIFQTKDSQGYIPDAHYLPCKFYWFVPSVFGLPGQNIQFPTDFAAVLALVSGLLGVIPRRLLIYLHRVEKRLWKTEAAMVLRAEGRTCLGKENRKRKPSLQRKMLQRGLSEEGLTAIEINHLMEYNSNNLGEKKGLMS